MTAAQNILNLCPDESMISIPVNVAAEIFKAQMDPNQGKGTIEDVHIMLFGHTKNLHHSITYHNAQTSTGSNTGIITGN